MHSVCIMYICMPTFTDCRCTVYTVQCNIHTCIVYMYNVYLHLQIVVVRFTFNEHSDMVLVRRLMFIDRTIFV